MNIHSLRISSNRVVHFNEMYALKTMYHENLQQWDISLPELDIRLVGPDLAKLIFLVLPEEIGLCWLKFKDHQFLTLDDRSLSIATWLFQHCTLEDIE